MLLIFIQTKNTATSLVDGEYQKKRGNQMDNPEKRATLGTQDEKKSKQKQNTVKYDIRFIFS
jgi:hypothetical protein